MTLAMRTAFGMRDIQAMNALKSVLSGGVNGGERLYSQGLRALQAPHMIRHKQLAANVRACGRQAASVSHLLSPQ
jgi:ABC-type phosphonate transport system ATPase subunit